MFSPFRSRVNHSSTAVGTSDDVPTLETSTPDGEVPASLDAIADAYAEVNARLESHYAALAAARAVQETRSRAVFDLKTACLGHLDVRLRDWMVEWEGLRPMARVRGILFSVDPIGAFEDGPGAFRRWVRCEDCGLFGWSVGICAKDHLDSYPRDQVWPARWHECAALRPTRRAREAGERW